MKRAKNTPKSSQSQFSSPSQFPSQSQGHSQPGDENGVANRSEVGKPSSRAANIATTSSRRRLFKRVGYALAGFAAAGAVAAVSEADQTAQAASGDNLILGNSNIASDSTYLSQTGGATLSDKAVLWADWYPANGKSAAPSVNAAISGTTTTNSSDGYAVGGYFQGNQAPILLAPAVATGAPTAGAHKKGELWVDSAGDLWLCQLDGTPGTWVKVNSTTSVTPSVGPNYLINGNFDVWQRGTSFTIASGNNYVADKWIIAKDVVGASTIADRIAFTPGQSAVPGEPAYYLRYAPTASSGATLNQLSQRMEDVRTLAGQQVTFSFWATSSVPVNINAEFVQRFGTGGSADVITSIASFNNLTTAWVKYTVTFNVPSISGKTIGSPGTHYTILRLNLPLNSAFGIWFAQCQLEASGSATAFKRRSFAEELSLCMRYYQKSFPYDTKPQAAPTTGRTGEAYFLQFAAGAVTQNLTHTVFPVPLRATPALTYYNPITAGSSMARSYSATADCTATLTAFNSEKNFVIQIIPPSGAPAGGAIGVHWTAEAELP